MPQTDGLIGSKDAAQLLGIDRSVLSRYVKRGLLEVAWQMPGRNGMKMFHRADVETLAATRAGELADRLAAIRIP